MHLDWSAIGVFIGFPGAVAGWIGYLNRQRIASRMRAWRQSSVGRTTLTEVSEAVRALNNTVNGLTKALDFEQSRRSQCEENIAQLRVDHSNTVQGFQQQVSSLKEIVTSAGKINELRTAVDQGFTDIRTLLRDRSAP